jgi:NDP-sugar pyrophosphorylase family protein
MSVHRVQDPSKGAAVYLQNGYLKSLLEKPPPGAASSQLDNAGVYVFTPRIFQMLDQVGLSPRKEYELTDALTLLVHNRYRVRAFEFGGFWSNVSSPEDLLEVNRLVIDRLSAAKSPPLPRTLPGVELSPLSVLHPQARLGRCSIGPYTLVDKGAQVMDGASVANSLICGNAVVGKDATLNHVMVRPECVVKAAAVHTGSRDNVVILPDEA